jgi:hypothetical protein
MNWNAQILKQIHHTCIIAVMVISHLLLVSTPTHNVDRVSPTNNNITSNKHIKIEDLSWGSITSQSCAYILDVEATAKVLIVSFNSNLS